MDAELSDELPIRWLDLGDNNLVFFFFLEA